MRRVPRGHQPRALRRLVFSDPRRGNCSPGSLASPVSTSIKARFSSALDIRGWLTSIQTRRASATSGRNGSAARSGFFMAEAEPVQPPADRSAVDAQAVSHLEFGADLVQRQVGLASKPIPQPICKRGQLATPTVALRQASKPAALPLQFDHVVHELRRHPEVQGVSQRARTDGAALAHLDARAPLRQTQQPGCEVQ